MFTTAGAWTPVTDCHGYRSPNGHFEQYMPPRPFEMWGGVPPRGHELPSFAGIHRSKFFIQLPHQVFEGVLADLVPPKEIRQAILLLTNLLQRTLVLAHVGSIAPWSMQVLTILPTMSWTSFLSRTWPYTVEK